jgi:hypothetical protein
MGDLFLFNGYLWAGFHKKRLFMGEKKVINGHIWVLWIVFVDKLRSFNG